MMIIVIVTTAVMNQEQGHVQTQGETPSRGVSGTRGGGGLPYESDGDARRKIRINSLKETNLGVVPALFNP